MAQGYPRSFCLPSSRSDGSNIQTPNFIQKAISLSSSEAKIPSSFISTSFEDQSIGRTQIIPSDALSSKTPVVTLSQNNGSHTLTEVKKERSSSYQQLIKKYSDIKNRHFNDQVDHYNSSNLCWANKGAVNIFYEISTLLKSPPDVLNPAMGGIAIWQKPKLHGFFHSFEIRDDTNFTLPLSGNNCLIVRLNKPVKAKTIKHVSKVINSIWYEPKGNIQAVECSSINTAIVTFAIIKLYDQGNLNKGEIKSMYDDFMKTITDEPSFREALEVFIFSSN